MNRRALLTSLCAVAPLTGCLTTGDSGSELTRLDYVEVWNSNDAAQTFRVTLFDATGEQLFEQTATVSGATAGHYTRKVLSEAPESAATVRANVNDETAEKDLGTYDEPVLLSVKYNDEGQVRITGFV